MERIYLDYNATSIIYPQVSDLMIEMLKEYIPRNPSSIHADGRKARGLLERARLQIAKALSIDAYKDDVQIIFTSSGSEANNLAINNFSNIAMFAGATEHVSVLEVGHSNLTIIPVDQNGIINQHIFQEMLQNIQGPKLVSIMLANNETGVIQNIKLLSEIARKEGAIFHCDASQAFGKIKVNFKDLGCDLMTISSHKSGGPVGAAALIAKKEINLRANILGGKQELGLRAGTENILAISGFGLAAEISKDKYNATSSLRDYFENEIDGESIANEALRLPNTSCIRMPNVKNEEQLIKFDLAGISLSSGSACSSGRIANSHVLKAMGIKENIANEIIRVSIGPNTTKQEINEFIKLWKDIYNHGK
jgi:cysteine desulfurase